MINVWVAEEIDVAPDLGIVPMGISTDDVEEQPRIHVGGEKWSFKTARRLYEIDAIVGERKPEKIITRTYVHIVIHLKSELLLHAP